MHARTRHTKRVETVCRWAFGATLSLGLLAVGCEVDNADKTTQRHQQNQGRITPPAEKPLEAADDAEPKSPGILPDTHMAAGRLHESQGHLARAVDQYRQVIAMAPRHVEAYNRLGIVLDQLGRYRDAEETFLKAIKIDPRQAHLRNNLAFGYILQARWPDAEAALVAALRQNPGFTRARVNLGMVLAQQNRFDEAFQQFAHALPKADAYYNLGLMYQSRSKLPEAAQAFKKALEHDQKLVAAQKRLDKLPPEAVKAAATTTVPGTERIVAATPPVSADQPTVAPPGSETNENAPNAGSLTDATPGVQAEDAQPIAPDLLAAADTLPEHNVLQTDVENEAQTTSDDRAADASTADISEQIESGEAMPASGTDTATDADQGRSPRPGPLPCAGPSTALSEAQPQPAPDAGASEGDAAAAVEAATAADSSESADADGSEPDSASTSDTAEVSAHSTESADTATTTLEPEQAGTHDAPFSTETTADDATLSEPIAPLSDSLNAVDVSEVDPAAPAGTEVFEPASDRSDEPAQAVNADPAQDDSGSVSSEHVAMLEEPLPFVTPDSILRDPEFAAAVQASIGLGTAQEEVHTPEFESAAPISPSPFNAEVAAPPSTSPAFNAREASPSAEPAPEPEAAAPSTAPAQ